MKCNSLASQSGFTLIEILLVAAIGGVLLTALTISTGVFLDNYSVALDSQDLTLAHQIALDRVLDSITEAEEIEVESSNSIRLTFPDGNSDRYFWSGNAGECLKLERNGGDAHPFVDGVVSLDFTGNIASAYNEVIQVETENLLSFDDFSGYAFGWENHAIEPSSLHGFTFYITWNERVEEIALTQLDLRLAKLPAQQGDLKISLLEGITEKVPRMIGDAIASCVISNADIAAAYWDGHDWVIGSTTFVLTEDFVIQPNRYYCLLCEPAGGVEAATMAVACITSNYGPVNGSVYIGSVDGGATWDPPLTWGEYRQKDVPFQLTGDVQFYERIPEQYVKSVDVTLGIELGGKEEYGSGRAQVRGGGER